MKKTTLRHVGQSMAEGSFNFVRQCTSQQILDTNHKKIYNKNSLLVRYPFVMQLAILSRRQIV